MKKKIVAIVLAVVLLVSHQITNKPTTSKAQQDATSLAQNLSFTGTWSSDKWLMSEEQDDWYKLVIPSDGRVELKVMTYIDGFTYFQLYTSDFSERLYRDYAYDGNMTQPDTKVVNYSLSKGIYYLKVDNESYTGKYRLNASFTSYGVNDNNAHSYDSPQTYSLGTTITGAITATDDQDWFKVVIPKNAYYVFSLSSYADPYTNFWIYNKDLSETEENGDAYQGSLSKPAVTKKECVLAKGTHYIKISGDEGKYIFTLCALNQSNCEHAYENTWVNETYLQNGYTLHKCKKCGKTYKDEYIKKKTLNQNYFWSIGGVVAGKKKVKLGWSTTYDSDGYQIQYAQNKKMKKAKVIKVKNGYRSTKTIKKLKKKKRYYFRIRAYKKVQGKTVYAKWSKKRSAKVK